MKNNNFVGNSNQMVDFLGNRWNFDCLGCAIVKKEVQIPGGIIYEGKNAILGADPEIPIPGFLIINVKRHVYSFSQLNKEERNEIGNLITYAEKASKELKSVEEITLLQEERSKHLHIWIFPNYKWMTEKFGKGISYLREISEYAKKNCKEKNIQEVLDTTKKIKEYFTEHDIDE